MDKLVAFASESIFCVSYTHRWDKEENQYIWLVLQKATAVLSDCSEYSFKDLRSWHQADGASKPTHLWTQITCPEGWPSGSMELQTRLGDHGTERFLIFKSRKHGMELLIKEGGPYARRRYVLNICMTRLGVHECETQLSDWRIDWFSEEAKDSFYFDIVKRETDHDIELELIIENVLMVNNCGSYFGLRFERVNSREADRLMHCGDYVGLQKVVSCSRYCVQQHFSLAMSEFTEILKVTWPAIEDPEMDEMFQEFWEWVMGLGPASSRSLYGGLYSPYQIVVLTKLWLDEDEPIIRKSWDDYPVIVLGRGIGDVHAHDLLIVEGWADRPMLDIPDVPFEISDYLKLSIPRRPLVDHIYFNRDGWCIQARDTGYNVELHATRDDSSDDENYQFDCDCGHCVDGLCVDSDWIKEPDEYYSV